MSLLKLQFVCVHGCPHELIGEADAIFDTARKALDEGHTVAVVIEDHRAAMDQEFEDLEETVETVGRLFGGYHPK